MERIVKHTFVNIFGKKSGHSYQFDFPEPIRAIAGGRISAVIVKRFIGVDLSYVYFLRTDGLYGSRTITFFNGKPDYVSFAIANLGIIDSDLSFHRYNDGGEFYTTNLHDLWGIQFTLFDVSGLAVDPPDIGWSFTVELEFKIKA